MKLADSVSKAPSLSFPKLASSDGELEGMYRFLSNEDVGWRDILRPHVEATVARCASRADTLVVHDSSEFQFPTADEARELGLLNGYGARGFIGHFALALSDAETRTPLGVLAFQPVVRRRYRASLKQYSHYERTHVLSRTPAEEKEQERWFRGVEDVECQLEGRTSAIHVMDRGAEGYMLWSRLASRSWRFVIRAVSRPGRAERIERSLENSEVLVSREVPLSRRGRKPMGTSKEHPPRKRRTAQLCVRACRVTLRRPKAVEPIVPEETSLNVVEVLERDPPAGQEPVSWQLFTSEPIETPAQVERIVDLYRARWVVEEYFKALKTGCAYERRQLMTLRALLNALAVFIPIAWRLLLLRTAARNTPLAPASDYFETDELALLRWRSKRVKLPQRPTVEQALLALAGIGGHLKRNGPPGWQTLAAGYEEFCSLLQGFRAAREM